ncbi:uncharacterized protein SAPINGB_P000457 [Magnusiomyces paraingens]|uniref:Uncharacterized protein n=1 Tax=Magnusiomyces paraingens TaxID=2606893 RepID=A0A5E8B195_9ASCO|nr:uncharacterized protein SAPINGB_P000457 [Saprochaete ingens]VVT44560.1 unnamed protein product [Saprochaete ingens]
MLRTSAWQKTLMRKCHCKHPPNHPALSLPTINLPPHYPHHRFFHVTHSTQYGRPFRISRGITTPKASLKGLLTALAILVTSASGYIFVQTQLFHENVFFPLYVTPKARHPVGKFVPSSSSTLVDSSQLLLKETLCDDLTDNNSVRKHLLAQLYKRLAVDETVSSVVGMPVTRLRDFDELDVRVVAKRYWVVGIQFLSPVSPLAASTDDSSATPPSSQSVAPIYKFVFRKQARVLHTDSVASFFRSAFGRDPIGTTGDDDDGKKGGDASHELNTIIQLEGDVPQNVGEVGPRPGSKRRPGEGEDNGPEGENEGNTENGKNGNKKKNLEDLIPHKNQIQMVASGSVTIRGPGGIHRHGHHNHTTSNHDNHKHQKHSFLYDQVIIKGTRTNLHEEDDKEDEGLGEKSNDDNERITTASIRITDGEKDDEAVTEAKLEFVATKSLLPNEVGIRFLYTALVYTDPRTGESVRQRLW